MTEDRIYWNEIEDQVLRRPPRDEIEISKNKIVHPKNSGYKISSMGSPKGQSIDYRKSLADNRGLHIREYENKYKIHWDEKDPRENPLVHLKKDSPEWLVGLTILGSIGAGILFKKFK